MKRTLYRTLALSSIQRRTLKHYQLILPGQKFWVLKEKTRYINTSFQKRIAEVFEGSGSQYGLLVKGQYEKDKWSFLVPESLRARLLNLTHRARLSGHPGQRRMMDKLRRTYYWSEMAYNAAETVRNFAQCAKNLIRLRRSTNKIQLFLSYQPLQ